ncbi:hypothetical protein ACO22_06055 [Paracoccidioides brasiliensis]|uniref:Uncharacterized protein n=1 Tax=Paracoccidioides brasiliensis TaxID=121759 RepID=A0A1D2J8P2_PARBR|nr:hypothetical protein ACO22_06055 [Paracoccidioides brasiliensis]
MGGVSSMSNDWIPQTSLVPLSIFISTSTEKWYEQEATGGFPPGRTSCCAVSASEENRGPYEIFILGGARKVDLVLAEKEYIDLGKGPRSHPHSNGSHYLSPLHRYDSDAAPYQRSQIVKSTTPPVESNQNPGNSAAQKESAPGPDPKPVSNGLGIDVSPGMWVAEILGAIIGVVVLFFIVSQLKAYRRANTDQTLETLDFQFQNISRSSPVTNTIPTMESGYGRHPRYQAAYNNCVLMQQGEYQAHSAESYACI